MAPSHQETPALPPYVRCFLPKDYDYKGHMWLDRHVLLVYFGLATLCISPVIILNNLLIFRRWTPGVTMGLGLACGTLVFLLSSRRYGNLPFLRIFFPGMITALLLLTAIQGGGVISATFVAFPLVPLMAGFLAGTRASLAFTVFLSLVSILFYIIHITPPYLFRYIRGSTQRQDHLIISVSVVVVLVMVGLFTWLYERITAGASQLAQERLKALHETNEKLEQALREAHAASRAKSDFLAHMSHELRTPINGVMGMNELLLMTSLDEKQSEYALDIRNSARALLSVISDILDFSKIESGAMPCQKAGTNTLAPVRGAFHLLAATAQDKGLEVVCEIAADVPSALQTDERLLQQILVNLLNNAVKYTPEGHIVVRLRVGAGEHGRLLYYEVEDTGIGLEAGIAETLFEPFVQGDHFLTRRFQGVGLGLAICQELSKLLGGHMGVESKPNKGSTFWFALPLQDAAPVAPADPPESLSGWRVLIADDLEISASTLSTQLAQWKLQVDMTTGLKEATEIIQEARDTQRPYDVLILDLEWRDGMPLLWLEEQLAQDGSFCQHILFLSGVGSLTPPDCGDIPTHSLRKPLMPDTLRAALLRWSDAQQATDEEQSSTPKQSYTGHVLVVEDDPISRKIAALYLDTLGCDVDLAQDGIEGTEKASQTHYDLILMDCRMPRLDGYEATRRILSHYETEHPTLTPPPIIAVTAHVLVDERDRCIQAGMIDYISKPYKPETLNKVLDTWLS